jgi:hypothetical protein
MPLLPPRSYSRSYPDKRFSEEDDVALLTAFITYLSPTVFLTGKGHTVYKSLITLARKLLLPTYQEQFSEWDFCVGTDDNAKVTMLAYAWLLVHRKESGVSWYWGYSIFYQATVNLPFANKLLADFDRNVHDIYESHFTTWTPAVGMGETACPTEENGVPTGAFSHLAHSFPTKLGEPCYSFRGPERSRLFPPLLGMSQVARAIGLIQAERFDQLPFQDHGYIARQKQLLNKVTAGPKPDLPVGHALLFSHNGINFDVPRLSPAHLWFDEHLDHHDLQCLYEDDGCALPAMPSRTETICPVLDPILCTAGYPWFLQDGTILRNFSGMPAAMPTAEETEAFYSRAEVPSRFKAPSASTSSGIFAGQNLIFSAMDEVTDNEEESKEGAPRRSTRQDPPPLFLGFPGKGDSSSTHPDFITWAAKVDQWWRIDHYRLHERTNHAASRLGGEALRYWQQHMPRVAAWYKKHKPQQYKHQGAYYIPYTAFKKVLSEKFAGYRHLDQLREDLRAFSRPTTMSIDAFNISFNLLVADIETYGADNAMPASELVQLYRRQCNLPIPAMQQHATDGHLHPWASVEALQTAAELEYLKQQEPSSGAVHALGGGRQPPHGRRRQTAPAKGRHKGKPASAESQTIASLRAEIATLQGAISKRHGTKERHPSAFKKTRFSTPPSQQSRQHFPPPQHRQTCTFCGRPGHQEKFCRDKKKEQHFQNSRR